MPIRLTARALAISLLLCRAAATAGESWPPPMPGASNGTVIVRSELFLQAPSSVVAAARKEGAAPFDLAHVPPVVELALHTNLPDAALNGTGWSCWGDIGVASNGAVYCGIGDHGDDAGGTARAYLYAWDPEAHALRQVADLNAIVPRAAGEPAWSKLHARIDEGPDGGIYFTGTLNDGARAPDPKHKWSDAIPGGQLYRYDPAACRAEVFANLPARRCTATCILDRDRNTWWCNLEGPSNTLFALDLATRKPAYTSPEGAVAFNRNIALTRNGSVLFNGRGGFWLYDAKRQRLAQTRTSLGSNVNMRASTAETRDGWIYGVTHSPGRLFRYSPRKDKAEMLGPDFLKGEYTTVCVLSPDERFVYYMPGAHGNAAKLGTPVIQYDIARRQRKVLAFLKEPLEAAGRFVPGGTYGVKISADGSTLYANLNGHPAAAIRPAKMKQDGFGMTGFVAIRIPESER